MLSPILHTNFRKLVLLTAVALALLACGGLPKISRPTSQEDQIKRGIQEALDLYARAYNENEPALLKEAVDQSNLPFRRFVNTRFESALKSSSAGQFAFRFKVAGIQPRDLGFVQAHITLRGGIAADWLFREVEGRWVLSEPTAEQLGEPIKVEHEYFTFYTYAWAEDVNPILIELMENARRRVQERLGKVPDQKADVKLKPIYGLDPYDDPFAVAYYALGRRAGEPDRIEIYTPNSYGFGFYDAEVGWQAEMERVLVHEYTHMTHRRSFDNVGKLSSWMVEGLAQYVSDDPYTPDALRAALKAGTIIPIIDTSTEVYKQDLMHMELLEQDRALAYAFAHSLVIYITETYGGMEGFWKLAQAYEETQDLDEALREAFGVSYEQFDQDWRAWLQEKY